MERCDPNEGLAKFVRSHERVLYHRCPDIFQNPDDPKEPLKPYFTLPERDLNWDQLSDAKKRDAEEMEKERITRWPIWIEITGFQRKHMERGIPPSMRRDAIVKLIRQVHGLVKAELRIDNEKHELDKGERALFWDPLPEICFHLGIAKSKFNSYLKEFSGMSAHELADRVRIHDIKKTIRDDLRQHARVWHASLKEGVFEDMNPRDAKFALLKHIRAERRATGVDRAALAARYRIPTFARLHRACLLHFGETHLQLELAIIDEVLRELRESDPQLVQKNTENAQSSPQRRRGAENSQEEGNSNSFDTESTENRLI